jgi:uncharacterized protein YbaR (Trm112 family)
MLYGNWGCNPNLKNQPPTPGIGLRRQIHRAFQTYTCNETGTSSICPKCDGKLEHPCVTERETVDKQKIFIYSHHVLRCKKRKLWYMVEHRYTWFSEHQGGKDYIVFEKEN